MEGHETIDTTLWYIFFCKKGILKEHEKDVNRTCGSSRTIYLICQVFEGFIRRKYISALLFIAGCVLCLL